LNLIPKAEAMKAASFEYACPTSLTEAVQLLAANEGAKLIAGGQSLMPLMAFRLATPSLLVDLRRLAELTRIRISDGGVSLGARVRWCDIEMSKDLARAQPLLVSGIAHVAHYQIRNRGTVGGSLAHADAAAEMPGLAVTLDAQIKVLGASGTRTIRAADFFVGALQTVLEPDEIITEVVLPVWPQDRHWGFEEFSRRRGDFALAGIALFYDTDPQGRCTNTHIGVIGAVSVPCRARGAEAALNGKVVDERTINEVARTAAAEVDPSEDLHGTADYRRALVEVLLERALKSAAARN
jgi:carbon-monoxide dehydrogenase medium subunit